MCVGVGQRGTHYKAEGETIKCLEVNTLTLLRVAVGRINKRVKGGGWVSLEIRN